MLVRLTLILFAILNHTCHYARCINEYNVNGITVCLMTEDTVDINVIEEIITIVEEQAHYYFPDVTNFRNRLAGVDFTIVVIQGDSFFATECRDFYLDQNGQQVFPMAKSCRHTASGLTSPDCNAIAIVHAPCIANSAIVHELIHMVQCLYLGGIDKNDQHPVPLFATMNKSGASAEEKALQKATLLCL